MRGMLGELRELWKFRELLLSMIERELRIRYKNSLFGFFWSLLNPLVTVVVMTLVFKYVMNNRTPSFSAYILAAYLPYMFFQLALMDSAQSVLASLPVVRKVYFPREILPLASICSNFIHFVLALGVYFLYLLVVWAADPRVWPFSWRICFLPVLLLVNFMLSAGMGLLISAANTFYEDVKYVVAVGLQLLFFLSPIMYFSENIQFASSIPESSRGLVFFLYHLNPIAMLSLAYRKTLVAPQPVFVDGVAHTPLSMPWGLFAITAGLSCVLLVGGYWAFNRVKWKFVERP